MDPDTITGNVIAGVIAGVILLVVTAAVGPLRRFVVRVAKVVGKLFTRFLSLRVKSPA